MRGAAELGARPSVQPLPTPSRSGNQQFTGPSQCRYSRGEVNGDARRVFAANLTLARVKPAPDLQAQLSDTIQEIAARYKVHPNQASTWKRQAMDGLGRVFSNGGDTVRVDHESEIHGLPAKIGEFTVERDFLSIWRAKEAPEKLKR